MNARVLLERMEKACQQAEKATGESTEEPTVKKKNNNEKETAMSFLLGATSTQSAEEDKSELNVLKRSHN